MQRSFIEHLLGYRQIPVSVRRALRRHPKLFKFQSSLQYDLINYIHYLRASEANPDYEMLNKRLRACTARHRCGVIICPICKLEKREKLCERVYAEVKKTSSLDLKFATFFFGITDGDLHSVQRLQDSGIRRIRNVIEKYRIKGFDYFDSIWFVGMIENDFIPQYVIERPPSFRSWYGGRSVADRWWNLFYGLGYERRFEHSPILVTYHAIACIPKAKLVGRKFRTWPKTDYFSNVRRAELDAQKHNLAFFPVPYQIRFQPLREEQEISNAIDLLVTYVSKMNSAYTELEPDIDLSKPKKKPPRRGTRSLVLKGLKAKYLTPLSDPDMNERLKLIANKKFQNLKREINLGRKR